INTDSAIWLAIAQPSSRLKRSKASATIRKHRRVVSNPRCPLRFTGDLIQPCAGYPRLILNRASEKADVDGFRPSTVHAHRLPLSPAPVRRRTNRRNIMKAKHAGLHSATVVLLDRKSTRL